MKVLFVISNANAHGGTEALAFNVLYKLREKGLECWLLSIIPYLGTDANVLSFENKDFEYWLHKSINPLNKYFGNVVSDYILRKMILDIAKKVDADWIINHTYDLCAAIPVKDGIKTAQVLHWSVCGYEAELRAKYNTPIKKTYGLPMLKILFRRWHKALCNFDKIISLTKSAKSELADLIPQIENKRYCIIPNFILYDKDSSRISSLNNKNIVFVGRLSHEKGVMRLLRIWEMVESQLPTYKLSIYGDGYAETEMLEYIKEHKLKSVVMKGYSDDKESIYCNADLLLMTSNTEGFGLVIIEAMYYGVPCVSFDCPVSPREIIANTGITIPCFNEEMYSKSVVDLLNNKEKLKGLQKNAIEHAKDFYTYKIIDLWMQLIKSND